MELEDLLHTLPTIRRLLLLLPLGLVGCTLFNNHQEANHDRDLL
jgi:hypothetical protein